MNTSTIIKNILFAGVLFAGNAFAQSRPGLSLNEGGLGISWNASIQRAVAVMRSAGFQNVRATGYGPGSPSRTAFVGGYTSTINAYIVCRPNGNGSAYTVVVASNNGSSANSVRTRLANAMRSGTASSNQVTFHGQWRLVDHGNRVITLRQSGNRIFMSDPGVNGSGSGTISRGANGSLVANIRGYLGPSWGNGGWTITLSPSNPRAFRGTWVHDRTGRRGTITGSR